MKFIKSAAFSATAVAAVLAAGAASAQEPEVAFNIGVTSDYVFRGFSQTNEEVAFQGGVDVTLGSFYVGGWASNVDFGDDTDGEIDIYGGYRTEAYGYAFDFGVVGYFYPGEPDGADYSYYELKAAASRAVGPATIGAVVFYSPDFFGTVDEEAVYFEGNIAFALSDKWSASAAVGRQALDVSVDYTTWNVGVAYGLTEEAALDFRYHDTDIETPFSEERFVASLKIGF